MTINYQQPFYNQYQSPNGATHIYPQTPFVPQQPKFYPQTPPQSYSEQLYIETS